MKRSLVVAALMIAACAACDGKKQKWFGADAKVENGQVVVRVTCPEGPPYYTAVVRGQSAECPATLRLPASVLGAGKHQLEVSFTGNVQQPPIAVAVEVPPGDYGPALSISRCTIKSMGDVDVKMAGRPMPLDCTLFDGVATLVFDANPGAKVTFQGKTYDVSKDGTVEVAADLGVELQKLTFDQIADTVYRWEFSLPATIEAGGKSAEAKIEFSMLHRESVFSGWMKGLAKAVKRPTFKPGAQPLYAVVGPTIVASDPKRTVGELTAIAIAEETNKRADGECTYIAKDGSKTEIKRLLYDANVTVLDTATWKQVATKTFPSSGMCPEVRLMTKGADTSTHSAPAHPDWRAVLAWMTSLKT